ncbi:MAG: hypothetical protein A2Y00_09175 [Omnitrophica WOR_2 bacterium GWF2_43_52]|nr:MAG: hypothetical protein A2062_00180 [Omnitrophica WOR_2 bacterium GWA2_44_7]OGX21932.1 MAG: hypothetical protein A2Y00_09175 [Omnitrophica WOR_2 bacterium GWF2_43_52]HAH20060.1 hypothetical protein [Candidatus Omnitrophota bacterium]HBG63101.1 hypothetical protein [Candidatus Omnitrophota bacterium]
MPKKNYLLLVGYGGMLFFCLPAISLAQSTEEVTFETYYPAPYGAYSELTTTGKTVLATENDNVGIGTTNPDVNALLHVYRNSSTATATVAIQNAGGRAAELEITSDEGQWDLRAPGSLNANSGKFIFQQVTVSNNFQRLVIDSSGNIGIGTTSPRVSVPFPGPNLDVEDVWLRNVNEGSGGWASDLQRVDCRPATGNPNDGWIYAQGRSNEWLRCPRGSYVAGVKTGFGSHRMWDMRGILCCKSGESADPYNPQVVVCDLLTGNEQACCLDGGDWNAGQGICYFGGTACPVGWVQQASYSSTQARTCTGCTTGWHEQANLGLEQCTWDEYPCCSWGTCCGSSSCPTCPPPCWPCCTGTCRVTYTCTAIQAAVGCIPN